MKLVKASSQGRGLTHTVVVVDVGPEWLEVVTVIVVVVAVGLLLVVVVLGPPPRLY